MCVCVVGLNSRMSEDRAQRKFMRTMVLKSRYNRPLKSNNPVGTYSVDNPRTEEPEMPLFRKFPEIRKFAIERKNFRKNETVSLDKNN